MKVIIKEKRTEYDGFFTLEKTRLQFERFDGTMSQVVVRENFYRGDSVAVLLYDPHNKKGLFTEQFRYPVYTNEKDKAWLLEVVAGSIKQGEDARETLVREVKEEVNLDINADDLHFINQFYVSPGGTSERIYIYAASLDLSQNIDFYGGEKSEHEDIKIVILPFEKIFAMLRNNEIRDAKTMIAVQWLKMNI